MDTNIRIHTKTFACVSIGKLSVYFSYKTPIAFWIDTDLVIRENDWGNTTGKHLNTICRDKSIRISAAEFETAFQQMLEEHGLSQ